MKVKFKPLKGGIHGGLVPKKATDNAACFDIVATSFHYDDILDLFVYGTGFATEIEQGYKAVIVPRSSITGQGLVLPNSPAQIDSDYRGEWILKFRNVKNATIYQPGERIAQVYFEKIIDVEWEVVEELTKTKRGDGGFGSTGKKASEIFQMKVKNVKGK